MFETIEMHEVKRGTEDKISIAQLIERRDPLQTPETKKQALTSSIDVIESDIYVWILPSQITLYHCSISQT